MMLVSLIRLKGFIQTYEGYNFDQFSDPELEQLKNLAGQALYELRWEMADELGNLQEESEKTKMIYYLQSQLTYMAGSLSGFDRENKPEKGMAAIFRWLQNGLFDLLDHMRVYFTGYFDFKMELPAGFAGVVKPAYPCFDAVKDNLGRSLADPGLSALIIRFSAATDQSDRFRVRTWRQWDFLVKTIGAIDHFLDDPPQGDINLGLLKLFVCRQFNSIQIYAYFLQYIERATTGETGYTEQKQELLYLLKVFKQVRVEGPHSYDPDVQQLKTSVLESLVAEIQFLEEKNKLFLQHFRLTNPASPARFYFSVEVTLAELMFFCRLMLEVGFMQTKFNSFLYEFISNHIRTKKADHISKKSMRNHFNNKPFPDRVVQNVRLWLTKMISHLDLYYKADW